MGYYYHPLILSSMFDVATVQAAYTGLIGWRGSDNTEMPPISSDNSGSTSGLYYNDAHPLITVENLDAAGPNYDGVANSTWSSLTTYAANAVVRYNGVTYISLQGTNLNKIPSSQPLWWKAQFNNYLTQLKNTAVVNMVQRVINDKQLSGASKALLDDVKLFDSEGRTTSTVVAQSRFVGFEIKAKNYEGLIAVINKIGGQFSQIQTGLTIYLYHSSQTTAVATYSMTTTKANTMEWFTPTSFEMNFCKYSKNDAGGSWYLGYYEDDLDLSGQAINRDIDLVSAPCGDCWKDAYNRFAWEMRNRFFTLTPIAIEYNYLNGTSLPDLEHVGYVSNQNWGLNLGLTVRCDLTDFFVENKAVFTRALWKQMAHDVLRAIAFSTRLDGITQAIKADAYTELKGDPQKPYKSGLEHELNKEYEALNLGILDIHSPCLSKKNRGIKVGGI